MPIYEYRCTKCQRVIEAIQKYDDPPLTTCEVCAGPLEKMVSRSAFLLKGGGWFQQNYSKPSGGSGSDSGSDSGSKPDSGSDGKGKSEASAAGSATSSGGGCGSGSCGCKH